MADQQASATPDDKAHSVAMQQFIALANQLQNQGIRKEVVSAALMSASGVYATYVAAGNQGYLTESGVNRVAKVYRSNLQGIQKVKKAIAEQQPAGKQGGRD